MYFLYSLGGVTFNKCWITLSILNCYSPNFQWFILMTNALNNQVGMLGDMFLWLVANLMQGVIYFIKQGGGNHKIAWVYGIWIGFWGPAWSFWFLGIWCGTFASYTENSPIVQWLFYGTSIKRTWKFLRNLSL